MLSIGIQPDILLCRSDRFLSNDIKSKIALFCNLEEKAVITARDVASIYEVPLAFAQEHVDELILKYLRIDTARSRSRRMEGAARTLLPPQGRSLHRHRRQIR